MRRKKPIDEKHELSESIYMSGHGLDRKDGDDIAEQLYHEGYRKQSEGEWIINGVDGNRIGNWRCSSCRGVSLKNSNYCPNCGSKMGGGE